MEKCGPDVVDVSLQRKHTTLLLIVPDFDKRVVSSRHEERELGVKVDTSGGSIMCLDEMEITSNLATHIFML